MYTVLNVTDDLTHCGHIGHQVNDFRTMCELAQRHGFDAVNVDFNHDVAMTPAERRAILEASELRAAAFGLPVAIYSQHGDAEFRRGLARFEKQAEQAGQIGCRVIAYLLPFSNEMRFDDYFRCFSKRMAALGPILDTHGLELALEFIGPVGTRVSTRYDFVHTIDGVRCLIAASDLYGRAGFKLDVHHWQNSGAGLLDLHHLDLEYILYVELNDGLEGHDMFMMPEFRRELPLRTGMTNVAGFMRALKRKGYQGPVAVEPWNQRIKDMPLEDAVRTVKSALDECLRIDVSTPGVAMAGVPT
jgi:sugar phosphate isomerase/epimerase